MKWFRLYTEIRDDPKMRSLSDREFRTFIHLLCTAAECEKSGFIPGTSLDLSWICRTKQQAMESTLARLVMLEVIEPCDGGYRFIHWEKRQFRSDNISERVARFRSKQQKCETLHETLHVTDRTEQSRNTLISPFENQTPSHPKNTHVPYTEIRNLWREILPELQQPRPENDSWHKDCRTRWLSYPKAQEEGLEWCTRFFEKIRTITFYMGENDRGWKPDIAWVWKKRNFFKILER